MFLKKQVSIKKKLKMYNAVLSADRNIVRLDKDIKKIKKEMDILFFCNTWKDSAKISMNKYARYLPILGSSLNKPVIREVLNFSYPKILNP